MSDIPGGAGVTLKPVSKGQRRPKWARSGCSRNWAKVGIPTRVWPPTLAVPNSFHTGCALGSRSSVHRSLLSFRPTLVVNGYEGLVRARVVEILPSGHPQKGPIAGLPAGVQIALRWEAT